eukprot:TRINITY_DN76083_c0_g1_i1.p1 TRINITY_DN76083_c0_g1~~TRINITY_DN76083_c0_g1_i1.p1  ORF type:complete len:522 (+),score=100.45 TRINITY_DN76083_c0_g1_i1:29-1594(+)
MVWFVRFIRRFPHGQSRGAGVGRRFASVHGVAKQRQGAREKDTVHRATRFLQSYSEWQESSRSGVAAAKPQLPPELEADPKEATRWLRDLGRCLRSPPASTSSQKRVAPARGSAALDLLRALEAVGFKPEEFHYGAAMGSLVKTGQWRLALHLSREMVERTLEVGTVIFSTIIGACEKSGQADKALQLFHSMRVSRIPYSTISFNTTLSACEKGGRWQSAVALLQQMLDTAIRQDAATFSAVISACEKASRWADALLVFGSMEDAGIDRNVICYGGAVSACEKGAQWEKALELLGSMEATSVQQDTVVCNAAASACDEGWEWEAAIGVFASMTKHDIRRSHITYGALLGACAKAGRWEMAISLLDDMTFSKIEKLNEHCSAAVNACAAGRQVQAAVTCYDSLCAAGVQPDFVSEAALARATQGSSGVAAGGGPSACTWLHDLQGGQPGAASSAKQRSTQGSAPDLFDAAMGVSRWHAMHPAASKAPACDSFEDWAAASGDLSSDTRHVLRGLAFAPPPVSL